MFQIKFIWLLKYTLFSVKHQVIHNDAMYITTHYIFVWIIYQNGVYAIFQLQMHMNTISTISKRNKK